MELVGSEPPDVPELKSLQDTEATGGRRQAVSSSDDADSEGHQDEVADAVLARRAVLGDRTAFTTIFHRHGPAMFRYALNMLEGNTQDAEDALQATWTKVWINIGTFRGQSTLRTWLFTVTAHEVLNQRRRRRPVPVEDDLLIPHPDKAHLTPAAQLNHQELREALAAALTELPWRQRASWILREMEGQS